jgi:malate dehydrogenase
MKITVVGAGNVGATTVKCLADHDIANEIVMIDIVEGVPQGKALDIAQSLALRNVDTKVIGTNDYADTKDSDIVVITAGVPRKPNMTREDLLNINAKIAENIASEAAKASPNAIFIVVTNPLDVMTQLVFKKSGLPKNRVIGMAGALDNARFKYFLAQELGASMADVSSLVLGSHGDTMVPVLSATMVRNTPLSKLVSPDKLAELAKRARDGGAEIVKLLKTGSAYYAPAESVAHIVRAIVLDKNELIACSAYCEGEYGINGVFCGVPAVINRKGIARIVQVPLDDEELRGLKHSADVVKENCKILNIL